MFAENSPGAFGLAKLAPRVASGHICYRRGLARRIAAATAACLCYLLLLLLLLLLMLLPHVTDYCCCM